MNEYIQNNTCLFSQYRQLYENNRARFFPEGLQFFHPVSKHTYMLDSIGLHRTSPTFRKICRDYSVDYLYTSQSFGEEEQVEDCLEKAHNAKSYMYMDGTTFLYIAGVRIRQTSEGEVTVTAKKKKITLVPSLNLFRVS